MVPSPVEIPLEDQINAAVMHASAAELEAAQLEAAKQASEDAEFAAQVITYTCDETMDPTCFRVVLMFVAI